MVIKNIEAVIPPNTPHFVGDGFQVHGFIPGKHPLSMKRMSPFSCLVLVLLAFFLVFQQHG